MANRHGDFVWYELLTSDADAAASFYGAVVGWTTRNTEGAGVDYRIFGINGTDVAGFMVIRPEGDGGMRPGWLGYVGVDDVDSAAAEVTRNGGTQHIPPSDIPGVGRFAMVTDPQGVPFYLMRGTMDGASTSFSPAKSGHCHWNELATSDQAAALTFYSTMFGWQKGDAMPMGERGDYQFIVQNGDTIGAVMNRTPDGPPAAWSFYFGVDDIDVAAKTIADHGGAIHYGPAEVPGNVFIIVASDPQGAFFGLVGPRRS